MAPILSCKCSMQKNNTQNAVGLRAYDDGGAPYYPDCPANTQC